MMKLDKMIGVGSDCLKRKISRSSIGLNGLNFSMRIASKYSIFCRFDRMPALVFRNFFGLKTASNFSHYIPGINYLGLQKFNCFINNPLQKTLSLSSNSTISIQDICTCARTLTSVKYYRLESKPHNLHQHFYAESPEKTNSKTCFQNRFVQNKEYEKPINKIINKFDIQLIHLFNQQLIYKRDILTLINPVMLSYLKRAFYFDTSRGTNAVFQRADPPFISTVKPINRDSLYYKNIGMVLSDSDRAISAVEDVKTPSAINDFFQSINTQSFRQTRALKRDSNIESSGVTPEYVEEWEKQSKPGSLHQHFLYTRGVLASFKPLAISYLQKKFGFKLEHNQTISAAKKAEEPLTTSGFPKEINIQSLRRTRILKDSKNIESEQIREEKKQFQGLSKAFLLPKTVLVLGNPMLHYYRDNTEVFISKTDSKIPFVKVVEKASKRNSEAFKVIEEPLLHRNRTLENNENIVPKQMEEEKKQSTPIFLHQPSFYKRNTFTSLSPLMLSSLHEAFNFEFSDFKPGRIVASAKKTNNASKSISSFYREIEIQLPKKTENNNWSEYNAKRIAELKGQFIHIRHQFASSKMEFNNYFNTFKNVTAVSQCMEKSISFLKPVISDFQYNKGIKTGISDHNEAISVAKKVEEPVKIHGSLQNINIPSLQLTRVLKGSKSIESKHMGEEKKQFLPKLPPMSTLSKTVLILVNPAIRNYLRTDNSAALVSKAGSKISVANPASIPSKRDYEVFKVIKEPLLHRNRTLETNENIVPKQMEEEKKQSTPVFLHQSSFYKRNFYKKNLLASLSPLTLSYLQGTFNFELADLKPGRIVASAKKMIKELKSTGVSTQGADALPYQQVRNIQDFQDEEILKNDTEFRRGYLSSSFSDVKALKESVNSFNSDFFPIPLLNLERFDHNIETRYPDVDAGVSYSTEELVFKKSASQKNGLVTENKGNLQTKKGFPIEIQEDSLKEFFKEKKMQNHEIGLIADRVYRIIEKRISIEKDRRGLF